MLIGKNNIWFKSIGVCLAVSTSLSSAWAGDMEDAKPLPDTQYEASLLKDSRLYPNVGLRKQVSQGCYCSGAYFSVTGGYALGTPGSLAKGSPIVVSTGGDAVVHPVIVNPGAFNEFIPKIALSADRHVTGSAAAGYKFGNFRVEVSGEYRRFNMFADQGTVGGVDVKYSSRTQQYGALMSAFYDVEIPGLPIIPYLGVGAGIALSNTKFGVDFTQGGTTTSGSVGFSRGLSFVGAGMAGVAINLGDHIAVDFGYRFTNTLGGRATYDGQTNAATLNGVAGINLINVSGMGLREDSNDEDILYQETLDYPSMIAHEVRVGVRYRF